MTSPGRGSGKTLVGHGPMTSSDVTLSDVRESHDTC
jgi:hypothetical protein